MQSALTVYIIIIILFIISFNNLLLLNKGRVGESGLVVCRDTLLHSRLGRVGESGASCMQGHVVTESFRKSTGERGQLYAGARCYIVV